MSKPEILLITKNNQHLNSELDRLYTVHDFSAAPDKDALLAAAGQTVRALVGAGGSKVGADLLAKLPKLEIISVCGVGYDAYDLDAIRNGKLRLTNTPDVLTDDVADLALALMLMVARNLAAADQHVRTGKWLKGDLPLAHKLSGTRVGIFGLGRIGKAIARRCEGFDMKISYYSRNRQTDVSYAYAPSLIELAREVDYLVIAAPGGAATKNMINAEVLAALGKKGAVINVGRGSTVDEPALIEALQKNVIRGAGLDVFTNEPNVPQQLIDLDNVVLTPHLASGTHQTRKAMADLALANLAAHFAGTPLLTPVI